MRKITVTKCGCDNKDCPKRLEVSFGMGYIHVISTDRKGVVTEHVVGIKKIEKLMKSLKRFLEKTYAEYLPRFRPRKAGR